MRATADMWKKLPFGELAPIPYRRDFTPQDLDRLKDGLVPEAMEDKWFVYFEEPSLFLHRSWTGQPVYRVDIAPHDEGAVVTGAWRAAELENAGDADYQASMVDFLVGNLLLREGKPFPRPAGISGDQASLLQHHVSGTGYPHTPADPPTRKPGPPAHKPWWRFW